MRLLRTKGIGISRKKTLLAKTKTKTKSRKHVVRLRCLVRSNSSFSCYCYTRFMFCVRPISVSAPHVCSAPTVWPWLWRTLWTLSVSSIHPISWAGVDVLPNLFVRISSQAHLKIILRSSWDQAHLKIILRSTQDHGETISGSNQDLLRLITRWTQDETRQKRRPNRKG